MSNYSRDSRSGGNRNFGNPRFNRDRDRAEMFQATCANCGKQCEVPFRPNGSKPVLCKECFQNSKGSDSRRSDQRSYDRSQFNRDENRNRNDYQAQFDALNAKMDKILGLLTPAPIAEPVFESEIDKETINEIVDEVQEEEEEATEKKVKKTKPSTKAKKTAKKK